MTRQCDYDGSLQAVLELEDTARSHPGKKNRNVDSKLLI